MSKIELYNDDCLVVIKQVPSNSIDCIFSDIPYKLSQGGCSASSKFGSKNKWRDNPEKLHLYKTGKLFDHNNIKPKDYFGELTRVLKDGGHAYIVVNCHHLLSVLTEVEKNKLTLNNVLIMRKNNCVTNQWYMKDVEYIVFFRKGKAKAIHNHSIKTCIDVTMPPSKTRLHPTEKPLSLVQQLVENSTNEGDTVLDPFMGSGSTAIACLNTNRNFIGIELDENYFNIASKRIRDAEIDKTMRLL